MHPPSEASARRIILPAHGWTPRDDQLPAWQALEDGITRVAISAHRRWGKDDLSLHWTARSAFQRVGPYWHLLPQANQARKAIWDAVNPRTGRRRIDDAFPEELRASKREQDMFIQFKNGSTWQVIGSDNYDALVGSPPVGVVFSEYALSDPQAWAMLRPILAENGGWAIFISTPRGRNHFARIVDFARRDPEWFGQVLTVEDTGIIPLEIIERERRELTAERGAKEANAVISQEYYCNPDAAMPGAYYGDHMAAAEAEGRIGEYPWDSALPVGTASDLGHGDQTVVWFYQIRPSGRIRIIDVLVGSGVGVDWYARRILSRPYLHVDHIWPHDGGHGNLRDVEGTLQEQAESFGWRPIRVLDRDPTKTMGIQSVRRLFPMIEFNESPIPFEDETTDDARARMSRALDALRGYRRKWDESRQRFSDEPLHDWCSDYADALRYLARGKRDFWVDAPVKPVSAQTDPRREQARLTQYRRGYVVPSDEIEAWAPPQSYFE
jgi:phage terminase large subunit